MTQFNITINATSTTRYDIADALNRIAVQIEEGYLSGYNSNDDCEYNYNYNMNVSGNEYEAEDELDLEAARVDSEAEKLRDNEAELEILQSKTYLKGRFPKVNEEGIRMIQGAMSAICTKITIDCSYSDDFTIRAHKNVVQEQVDALTARLEQIDDVCLSGLFRIFSLGDKYWK